MNARIIFFAAVVMLSPFAGVASAEIAVTIEEPAPGREIPWPVFAAFALPDGYAASPSELAMIDDKGQAVAAWLMPVASWRGGGPIKWLHARWVAAPGRSYRLVKRSLPQTQPLPLEQSADGWTARSGKLELRISPRDFGITYDGKPVAAGLKQQITDLGGQTHLGNVESVVVERHSAVEVTFLIHGSYSHAARYYQRVTLFRDVPVVFFDHTWEYMGDMHKDKFREISVELLLPESPRSPVRFDLGDQGVKAFALEADRPLSMAQELAFHLNDDAPYIPGVEPLSAEWAAATAKPSGDGSKYGPDHFSVFAGDRLLHEGRRCGDAVMFNMAGLPVAAALADFWRHFPKEWEISSRSLKLHLWSKRGGVLDFSPEFGERWYRAVKRVTKGGTVRTGDPRTLHKRELFFLAFGEAAERSGVKDYATSAPEARVDPAAMCDARPFVLPVVPRGVHDEHGNVKAIEDSIDAMFAAMSHAVELTGGNGWQEAGHGVHYNYTWDDASNRLLVNNYRWFNHFYYLHRNLWTQYFRGGDRSYLDMLNRHFRHWLDIQVCHGGERDDLSPGSWCKDSLCYWENWQEGWKFTYQRTASEVMYYLARTGDPRARRQLEQWRQLFLDWTKDTDLTQWADEYRDWAGSDFSAWRVPCTAIANLITLHEIFGDQRLLDMALALTLSFEDISSPSGTKFILSGDQYEYTMWTGHDEYYRILPFYEICRLTNDPRAVAMTQKLIRYWLAQRAHEHGTYDLVALIAWDWMQDPRAGAMLRTYVEDSSARDRYLAMLLRPFGPDGPQGTLHPSNDQKMVFGMYPYLVAAYPSIVASKTEAATLHRFRSPNDLPTWIGHKQAGKPFVMSVLCPNTPGGDARLVTFFTEDQRGIPRQYITREDYRQQAGWSYTMYTLRLPADFPAGAIRSHGDAGRLVAGSEATYLFDPGRYLYFKPDSSREVIQLRPGRYPLAIGGEAAVRFTDGTGAAIAPKPTADDPRFAVYDAPDGIVNVSANMHWTRGAFLDLSRVPAEHRLGFVGDPHQVFTPPASALTSPGDEDNEQTPIPQAAYVPGISGEAFVVRSETPLQLPVVLDPAGGCVEFWIKPLWHTATSGAGQILKSNVLSLSAGYVGQFRAGAGSASSQGSYAIAKPEGVAAPLKHGQWYHVAITWMTPDKPIGRLPAGRALVWMTINGEPLRSHGPAPIDGKLQPDAPLTFTAGAKAAYLIDEIRISRSTRHLTLRTPGFSFMTYGGFDPQTLRKALPDEQTINIFHLDGHPQEESSDSRSTMP